MWILGPKIDTWGKTAKRNTPRKPGVNGGEDDCRRKLRVAVLGRVTYLNWP